MAALNLVSVIPPGEGGVRDFARLVAAQLGVEDRVMPLSKANAQTLAAGEGCDLLLQYSGYGYARRGAPVWLVRSLLEMRHRFRSFGVFFHELYAMRYPWSSAFWLSPAQRYVARRLAEIADFWLTSCDSYARWLSRYARDKRHAIIPISSNVGELESYSPARRPIVVVFGTAKLRETAYQEAGRALFAWARARDLEIHDLGARIEDRSIAQRLRTEGVIEHGRMEPAQISAILRAAQFGVVKHRAVQLAKSGVFAAYCAHGVCPIVLSREYDAADRLLPKRHYLPGLDQNDDSGCAAATTLGESAWRWYRDHRLERHGQAITTLIGGA